MIDTKKLNKMTSTKFFEEFDSLTSILKAFAYNLTQNHEQARDLYQETAYRALKNKEKFNPGTNFKAWLMTIMKNIFINDYRRRVKQNTMIDSTDNQYFINSGSETIQNDAMANILVQELIGMIDSLDESLRTPFLMHYQGFKYKEIAEKFQLPLGTIKSRIFFARKELKELIAKRYHVDNAESILERIK